MFLVFFAHMSVNRGTLNAQSEKRINAFEMKCYHKILCIPYSAHRTNENIKDKIVQQCGNKEMLLSIVKR